MGEGERGRGGKPAIDKEMVVVRAQEGLIFFSFSFEGTIYCCALVPWFSTYSDSPCEDAGLWRVEPDCDARGRHRSSVIHIDTILHSAHLIGVATSQDFYTP